MDKFYALSAPIRREILALLSEGEQLTATAIANSFKVSPPAISQHLKVLLNSRWAHCVGISDRGSGELFTF